MSLVEFWFIAIAILWTGFLVLEGFDFGVGMLHGFLGRDEAGRRAVINTIGPLWDGNEVWLIVAAAAMFAAFPGWYATMFSSLYLALVLLLVALIVRGLSFEFRGKVHHARWRRTWDALMTGGSLVAPLLIGVALGNLLHGLPIGDDQEYTGTFFDLLQPYPIYVGLTFVGLSVLHGATFVTLKTAGEVGERARRLARRIAPVVGGAVLIFVGWTHAIAGRALLAGIIEIAAVLAAFAATALLDRRRDGAAFAATTAAMAATVLSIFAELYPRVMVSSTNPAFSLTVNDTASGSYTLKLMTVVFVVLFPVVLLYQSWTYYVFRRRISREDLL